MTSSTVLIDASLLVAFYNAGDRYHAPVRSFFATCTSQLITSLACVAETMWLLASDSRVQNDFLLDLAEGVYRCEPLRQVDFLRISELNSQYADLPGDFADLTLIAISERLNIVAVATLDKDFDIYRRYRRQPFERVFRPV
jgi:predicted nucleic acid-binding protein